MGVVLKAVPIRSVNPPNSITANWIISGLVLKKTEGYRIGQGLGGDTQACCRSNWVILTVP